MLCKTLCIVIKSYNINIFEFYGTMFTTTPKSLIKF